MGTGALRSGQEYSPFQPLCISDFSVADKLVYEHRARAAEDDWGVSDGEILEDWPSGIPQHGSLPHAISSTLEEQEESPSDIRYTPEKAPGMRWAHLSAHEARRREKRAKKRAQKSSPFSCAGKLVAQKRAAEALKAPLLVGLFTSSLPVTKPSWTAIRQPPDRSVHRLKDVSLLPLKLVNWDGKASKPLVDSDGRVFTLLGAMPKDHGGQSWDRVIDGGTTAMRRCKSQCKFTPSQLSHRRGEFAVLEHGITFGGGQPVSKTSFHQVLAYSTCHRCQEISRILPQTN
jgi:hypothetical protein